MWDACRALPDPSSAVQVKWGADEDSPVLTFDTTAASTVIHGCLSKEYVDGEGVLHRNPDYRSTSGVISIEFTHDFGATGTSSNYIIDCTQDYIPEHEGDAAGACFISPRADVIPEVVVDPAFGVEVDPATTANDNTETIPPTQDGEEPAAEGDASAVDSALDDSVHADTTEGEDSTETISTQDGAEAGAAVDSALDESVTTTIEGADSSAENDSPVQNSADGVPAVEVETDSADQAEADTTSTAHDSAEEAEVEVAQPAEDAEAPRA